MTETIELRCSSCGADKNELAAFRAADGTVIVLMCKDCLREAIQAIEEQEQDREAPEDAN